MTAPDTTFEQVELSTESETTTDDDRQDDQIVITVQRGQDETAGWLLQPQESGWQIAQIAEDLEDHLIGLVEADHERKDTE